VRTSPIGRPASTRLALRGTCATERQSHAVPAGGLDGRPAARGWRDRSTRSEPGCEHLRVNLRTEAIDTGCPWRQTADDCHAVGIATTPAQIADAFRGKQTRLADDWRHWLVATAIVASNGPQMTKALASDLFAFRAQSRNLMPRSRRSARRKSTGQGVLRAVDSQSRHPQAVEIGVGRTLDPCPETTVRSIKTAVEAVIKELRDGQPFQHLRLAASSPCPSVLHALRQRVR
jgi:hypothetical protein